VKPYNWIWKRSNKLPRKQNIAIKTYRQFLAYGERLNHGIRLK